MIDVALVTCAEHPDGWPDDHVLVDALRERGLRSEWACWDDPEARWGAAGIVVLRSTWDYPWRLDAFLDWLDYVGSIASLWNPPGLVRWNAHKRYLLDLEA